ncbi:MAG TPA: hypothetical protein VLU46_06025 [Thermoanaerobaculia bacterium]|nr:hypothetical protein [Thermoanaerobaculia bacterium]
MSDRTISAGGVHLAADLVVPAEACGIVVFAQGSGRTSPRNRAVAAHMHHRELATLLVDLLTPEETAMHRRVADLRSDAIRFARRLIFVTDALRDEDAVAGLDVAYFGTAIGAAAALIAAAHHPDRVKAVVARSGRPELAIEVLPKVRAATLLVVPAADPVLARLNQHAFGYLTCEKELDIVTSVDDIPELASSWFAAHLSPAMIA